VPLFHSLVATTVAPPAASAVTTPAWLTAAIVGAELDHTTVRPVSTFPDASVSLAEACAVWPTTREPALNVTATCDTGTGETLNPIDPLFPSLVAVTVIVPKAIAFRTPVGEMVATAVFDEVQPTVRPVRTLPDASLSVTLICIVAPALSDVELAVSNTVATGVGGGASTVRDAAPVCPSLVATTDADPALTAVMVPAGDTVATSTFALDHMTVRPVRMFPPASRSVAAA